MSEQVNQHVEWSKFDQRCRSSFEIDPFKMNVLQHFILETRNADKFDIGESIIFILQPKRGKIKLPPSETLKNF